MDMDQLVLVIVAALLGGCIGSGVIAAIGYRALKDKLIGDLKEVFAKRSELNNWGDRVNAFETVLTNARDGVDNNSDRILRLEQANALQWSPVSRVIERIEDRLNQHDRLIERTATLLDEISRRLDRDGK